MHVIRCRAKVHEHCYDGKPTSVQFGENLPMDEDGTYLPGDGGSLVCDACYIALGQPLNGPDLENTIAIFQERGVPMVECPAEGCDVRLAENDTPGQRAHLEEKHPDLIEKRLRDAGML